MYRPSVLQAKLVVTFGLLLMAAGIPVRRAAGAERPNVLLFTADDLHAESLGVYGGRPLDLTPNLDAFAKQSLLFERAHVNAAICAPCRAILATGRYSHRSGAMGFMKAREDVPGEALVHGDEAEEHLLHGIRQGVGRHQSRVPVDGHTLSAVQLTARPRARHEHLVLERRDLDRDRRQRVTDPTPKNCWQPFRLWQGRVRTVSSREG